MSAWQRLQQALRQRNSWLRHGTLDGASDAAWSRELSLASDEIDGYRRAYIQALKPVFETTLKALLDLDGLTLSYYRGWDKDRPLVDVLASSLERDRAMGHTQSGPQRADLRLKVGSHNAAEVLSRGQQKLVVCVAHCPRSSRQRGQARAMHLSGRRPALGAGCAAPTGVVRVTRTAELSGVYYLRRFNRFARRLG